MRRLLNSVWKKRLVCTGAVLLLLAGAMFVACLNRFNFSQDKFPHLAWIQEQLEINQPAAEQPHERPQIIGHRGSGLTSTVGSGLIGNTVEAIRTGIDAEADWIEIDIRRSQDGVLMVFHDANVNWTTNGAGEFERLCQDDLQCLQVNVDPVESIPTLQQVLKEFSCRDARFILDVKVKNIRDELLPLVAKHFSPDRIILFGSYDILEEYVGSGYTLGYTALFSEGWNSCRFPFGYSFILQRCEKLGCDYLILPAVFLNQSLIDDARSKGLNVWAYGSEDPRDWRQSAQRGITGLIVDQPMNVAQAFRKP